MSPEFSSRINVPVINHLTGESYYLKRMDELVLDESVISSLIHICNQAKIYSWLFKELFGGKPYGAKNAQEFIDFGIGGWSENSHFVFLLLTEDGNLAAAIDIKSADIEKAEIGYWASEEHRGCMTNTTKALLELARDAGFQSLYGRVKKGNGHSAAVMLRAGFKNNDSESAACEAYDYFYINL